MGIYLNVKYKHKEKIDFKIIENFVENLFIS